MIFWKITTNKNSVMCKVFLWKRLCTKVIESKKSLMMEGRLSGNCKWKIPGTERDWRFVCFASLWHGLRPSPGIWLYFNPSRIITCETSGTESGPNMKITSQTRGTDYEPNTNNTSRTRDTDYGRNINTSRIGRPVVTDVLTSIRWTYFRPLLETVRYSSWFRVFFE